MQPDSDEIQARFKLFLAGCGTVATAMKLPAAVSYESVGRTSTGRCRACGVPGLAEQVIYTDRASF